MIATRPTTFLLATLLTLSASAQTYPLTPSPTKLLVDTTQAPDLQTWTTNRVVPMMQEWYSRLNALLPNPNAHPPETIQLVIRPMDGVANTSGDRITASAGYFRDHPDDVGALFHELVHTVQAIPGYGTARSPVWLVEGIADYYRFYVYEPQAHAAEIRPARAAAVHYNDSYRTTANFLNWVTLKYDPSLTLDLNNAMRNGLYNDRLWHKLTGHSAPELGDEWKASLTSATAPTPNTK